MISILSPVKFRGCCIDSGSKEIIEALIEGARDELLLTPKPGLVDVYDSGSHKDLDFCKISRSIELFEQYYTEISDALHRGSNLHELRSIGISAETRMMERCGSNAHKGYLFSSALFLIASLARDNVREGIKDIAAVLFETQPEETNGAEIRKVYKVGGVVDEALKGFPVVFEDALPAYKNMMAGQGNHQIAGVYAMSKLMQSVEDTTSLHRCGKAGLAKIKSDGKNIQKMIEEGKSTFRFLEELNEEYKSINLTMGGVADMLALTFALSRLV